MVTLKDIAQRVGISVSAASMALRDHASIGEETKRKVREARDSLGYKVRSKPSGNIAFILFDRGFDFPVYARFFQSIGDAAARKEIHPLYFSFENATFFDTKLPSALHKRNVDGIIVSGVYAEEAHRRLRELEVPLVALGNYQLGVDPWAACEVDLPGGMRLMMGSLKKQGHRNVALLVSTPEKFAYGLQIRQMYSNSLAAFDLNSVGMLCDADIPKDEPEVALAGLLAPLLRQPNPPTAIVVERANPRLAEVLEDLGLRVPEDISIISLGRSAMQMRPSLATVESDPADMGRGAFEKLHRLMEDPQSLITREIFSMHLIPGKSLGPVPARA